MALPLYLAMTAAELAVSSPLPEKTAYMACHFSPYAAGLSCFPRFLPRGAMVILNDRTPIFHHDPALIRQQLAELAGQTEADCVLLDFQRADCPETAALVRALHGALPCPMGVSLPYAAELSCPVLLPPPPLPVSLQDYLAPWQGREVWLEAAPDSVCVTVTEKGAAVATLDAPPSEAALFDDSLACRYQVEQAADALIFSLWRSREDIPILLENAARLGVTRAVGLFQELG